jgi:hypothetical protein
MAAKASRIHTLFLLIALTVAGVTATVVVAPPQATAGSSGPTTNGDPDRPNDCPKPAAQQPTTNLVNGFSPITGGKLARGAQSGMYGWSWAMNFVATLLGRHGL